MSLTYQQQFVLDGLAGRAAILNLDARHNRLYSAGDLVGWITTFRHAGATFVRAGESFTDLRKAFDGGGGARLVTVDHEITVDGVDATQRCVALLLRDNRTSGLRHLHRPAHLRTWRLVLHVTRTRMGSSRRTRVRYPCERGHSVRVRIRHLRRRPAHGRHPDGAEVCRDGGERCAHSAFRVDGSRSQPRPTGTPISLARCGAVWSLRRRC